MSQHRIDIAYVSSSFLTNIAFTELLQITKYLRVMEENKKLPHSCHVSAQLFGECKARFGAKSELTFNGVIILPVDGSKAAEIFNTFAERYKTPTQKKNEKIAENKIIIRNEREKLEKELYKPKK